MVKASDFVTEARKWVGVPFRHQGRDRSGVDCVGLPIAVCMALNIPLRAVHDINARAYGRLPTGKIIEMVQRECVQIERAVEGALIVIAWQKLAAHVAICAGETIIHSYESVGRVVEHGYRGRWLRVTHSIWALRGVSHE